MFQTTNQSFFGIIFPYVSTVFGLGILTVLENLLPAMWAQRETHEVEHIVVHRRTTCWP